LLVQRCGHEEPVLSLRHAHASRDTRDRAHDLRGRAPNCRRSRSAMTADTEQAHDVLFATGMPYANNTELPERIRKTLPARAQDIFRAAFNAAYERYGPDEARAFRIAWGAVKRSYFQRAAGTWVRRPSRA
jgi:cation transport regulator